MGELPADALAFVEKVRAVRGLHADEASRQASGSHRDPCLAQSMWRFGKVQGERRAELLLSPRIVRIIGRDRLVRVSLFNSLLGPLGGSICVLLSTTRSEDAPRRVLGKASDPTNG